jgi:uncharacterized protein
MNIDYPFHFNSQGRSAVTSYPDHIRDMIELLLFTMPGERVNRPDFGSGLLQMVFEPNSPEIAATLQYLVQSNLQQYLGELIQLEDVSVDSRDASLTVTVRYQILQTQERRTEQFTRRV